MRRCRAGRRQHRRSQTSMTAPADDLAHRRQQLRADDRVGPNSATSARISSTTATARSTCRRRSFPQRPAHPATGTSTKRPRKPRMPDQCKATGTQLSSRAQPDGCIAPIIRKPIRCDGGVTPRATAPPYGIRLLHRAGRSDEEAARGRSGAIAFGGGSDRARDRSATPAAVPPGAADDWFAPVER